MVYIHTILAIVGAYISLYVMYNMTLIFIHWLLADKEKSIDHPVTVFKILIPAHNEELLLERLLKSIDKQDYPREKYDVLVIADNCTDHTAAIAIRNGASTIERVDKNNIGKGYAIKYGLESVARSRYDAIFVIDADSLVESTALQELDKAIQYGARIMQCYNGVVNPDDSWFTRLMDVSRTFGNEVLEPAKEKIGLSSHLMGNGMCFVRSVIEQYGWNAFTGGEDWEYYVKMVMLGERIVFVNRARVYHSESVNLKQATSQRFRWSGGRFAIAGKLGLPLFYDGVRKGNIVKIDASLPLLFPNPSLAISLTISTLLFCVFVLPQTSQVNNYIHLYYVLCAMQFSFFLVGMIYVREKKKKVLALLIAPVFLIWKTGIDLLSILGIGRNSWVRTDRKL